MPELPDVETYKRYLDATALHQRVARVRIEDATVLQDAIEPQALAAGLTGQQLESSRRHGKHLFAALDGGDWLLMHFGMTGRLQYYRAHDAMPDYTQVQLDFDNGYHLAYIAPRKLGEVAIIDDPDAFITEQGLGPDALGLGWDAFAALAEGRRGMVKTWLMDQETMAGIGNVYSDEILFQARLHPKTRLPDLGQAGLQQVFETMRQVLQQAIDVQCDPQRMSGFLVPHRGEGEPCPRCAGPIERIQAGGRGSYYCPRCQPAA